MSGQIYRQFSLKQLNTFAIDCVAETFCRVQTVAGLQDVLITGRPSLVLGGGSNLLFRENFFPGLVVQPMLKGIHAAVGSTGQVEVTAKAGETWHEFVMWCVQQGYGGLENMALIPGTVGAAPVQNIGAYGVELSDCVVHVDAINIESGHEKRFTRDECEFSYRSSCFKQHQKDKWIISSVTFSLTTGNHQLNTDYGAIRDCLQRQGIQQPTIGDIADVVIQIRSSKLPDPKVLPNAGSFFKNPVVTAAQFTVLQSEFKDIPGYVQGDQQVKVPAGWLIEQCGWKGHRRASCGVHEQHALVLVNHNGASGAQMMSLIMDIRQDVQQRFAIMLEPEVNILP